MDAVLQQGQAVLLEQFNTLLNKVGSSSCIVSIAMTTSAQTRLLLLQFLIILHTASHQNWTWGRPGNEASPCSVFHHRKILDMAWKWVTVPLVFSGPNFDSCIIICSHIFQVLSSRRIDHDYALYLLLSLPEEHAVGKLQAIRSRNVSSYSKVIVSLLFYSVGATSIAMLHFTDCV